MRYSPGKIIKQIYKEDPELIKKLRNMYVDLGDNYIYYFKKYIKEDRNKKRLNLLDIPISGQLLLQTLYKYDKENLIKVKFIESNQCGYRNYSAKIGMHRLSYDCIREASIKELTDLYIENNISNEEIYAFILAHEYAHYRQSLKNPKLLFERLELNFIHWGNQYVYRKIPAEAKADKFAIRMLKKSRKEKLDLSIIEEINQMNMSK